MNYLIDFVIAYPAWNIALLALSFYSYITCKSKEAKNFSKYAVLVTLIVGILVTFNSALVKPKTYVEPFKPSEVVTHQMNEEAASKPFTDRLSKPKESKLNDSLTFKQEVQKYNN